MKERILELLTEALPAVDFESDFLFSELDSLGIVTILLILSSEYRSNSVRQMLHQGISRPSTQLSLWLNLN